MKRISAKLGKMRKVAEWVVYPDLRNGLVVIQCDKRICAFDPNTGKGKLSAAHNYPIFVTLQMPNAETIIVPPEVIAAALAAQPKKGDAIVPGVAYIG